MIEADSVLSTVFHVNSNTKKVTHLNTGAELQVVSADGDVVSVLARHGVAYVLIDEARDESDVARAARLNAQNVLDQRSDLISVGSTARGELWSVGGSIAERSADESAGPTGSRIALLQLGVIAIALLLAVPTRTSLRDARRHPRVIGSRRNA
jgi:hypothetical protein